VPPNNQVFEIDRHVPLNGAQGTNLSHLCQTALGGGMAAFSPFIHKNRGLIHCAIPGTLQREILSREREKSIEPGSRAFSPSK
jgi:hypothetical protein